MEGEGPGGVEGEGPGGLGLQPRVSASYGPERTTAADSCSRRTQLPARAAPPPPLRTQPPPEPRPDARCAEAALRRHPGAACASHSPFAGKGMTAVVRKGSTPIPRSSIPSNLLFQWIPGSLFSLKQKEMPPSHFSKRQAPAESGLERRREKPFALILHPSAGYETARSSPLAPRRLLLLANPASLDTRERESRNFRPPSKLLAPHPRPQNSHFFISNM